MEEEALDLTKIAWNILLSWRMLIAWIVVLAVGLAGLKYGIDLNKYKSNVREQVISEEKSIEDISTNLSESDLTEVHSLMALYEQAKGLQEYIDNNPLMKVNPYKEKVLSLQYYIKLAKTGEVKYVEGEQTNGNLTSIEGMDTSEIYCRYAESEPIVNIIKSNTKTDLLKSEFGSLVRTNYSPAGGVFTINIIYVDGMDIDKISEEINEAILAKSKDLQNVSEHKLIVMDKSIVTKEDEDLIAARNSYFTQLSTVQNNAVTIETRLSDEQKAYLEMAQKIISANEVEEEQKEALNSETIPKPTISKKYAVLGAVLGIFIVFLIVFVRSTLSAKLVDSEEIINKCNVSILGIIDSRKNRKRFLDIVDKKLISIRDRRKKTLTHKQRVDNIVTSIALYCQKNQVSKVIISGSEIERVDEKYTDEIVAGLTEKSIISEVVNDIVYDAEALSKCAEAGNLVLLEQIGVSIKDEIINEINKAKEYNVNVMGTIVIE